MCSEADGVPSSAGLRSRVAPRPAAGLERDRDTEQSTQPGEPNPPDQELDHEQDEDDPCGRQKLPRRQPQGADAPGARIGEGQYASSIGLDSSVLGVVDETSTSELPDERRDVARGAVFVDPERADEHRDEL